MYMLTHTVGFKALISVLSYKKKAFPEKNYLNAFHDKVKMKSSRKIEVHKHYAIKVQ